MRLGLYGSPESAPARALAAGAAALGFRTFWREPARFSPDQAEEFQLVVVDGGLRGPLGRTVHFYERAQVPVLVLDTGFLRRGTFFQLGVGRLNWVPAGPLPPDRFLALDVRLTLEGPTGGNILVCGQVPDDSAHGLSRRELEDAYAYAARTARMYTRSPLVFRPHPADDGWQHLNGFTSIASPLFGSLDVCLRDAAAVVTLNSNAGHEALLAGIAVFTLRSPHPAAYAELAETDLSRLAAPEPPSSARRQEYFHRLAYGQWSLSELETGEPLRFLRGRGLIPGG